MYGQLFEGFSVAIRQRKEIMKTSAKLLLGLTAAILLLLGNVYTAMAIGVGDKAPDFNLSSSQGGKLSLRSLKGKNVLINFYVLDFSPT